MSGGPGGAVAAVDLGATSGRVVLARIDDRGIALEETGRFPNGPVRRDDGLHWDVGALWDGIVAGLRAAFAAEPGIRSIGIDSWAVDYALLRGGERIGDPFHYRDDRTDAAVERVHALVPAAELYARNGLQHLPFTTLFQLVADTRSDEADALLLIPDLVAFLLTGRAVAERTNASTTGLLGVGSREWDDELIARLGLRRELLPELVDPGAKIGELTPEIARLLGAPAGVRVIAVGSHDTASAVLAIPATRPDVAYISCGTWGLVGVELAAPVLTESARAAGFTNEGGVDGRVRFLHNVMGLWLLNESIRAWEADGERIDLAHLLAEAETVGPDVPIFDADDPAFLAPDRMPERIADWFTARGIAAPSGRAALTRSIVESLAATFARTVETASALSGRAVSAIHLVGGGSLNELLCRSLAARSGLPVLAGPVEATAIGNVLVQARAQRLVAATTIEQLRALVAAGFPPREYAPPPA